MITSKWSGLNRLNRLSCAIDWTLPTTTRDHEPIEVSSAFLFAVVRPVAFDNLFVA